MTNEKDFDVHKLKGKLGSIRDWMRSHHIPPLILFILLGIISTIWFLIRVIPKPSRATYPCMKVAAPFMSGFVAYLLTLGGITLALRKAKKNIYHARYIAAGSFIFVALVGMVFALTNGAQNIFASVSSVTGPDDGPNQPIGIGRGVNPGRVVWAWDPKATNENCTDYYFKPTNTNFKVVGKMVDESVKKLSGKNNLSESWDALFRSFNKQKKNVDKGYTKGEKIFIKINQTSARFDLNKEDQASGFYLRPSARPTLGTVQTGPAIVLEILRQLVNEAGVEQENIAVGDPQNHVFGYNSDAWMAEFPKIVLVDNVSKQHGRTLIHPTINELVFYSDKSQTDKLYDIIENADYMINVANLKPHLRAGISLTAKNHFGSQSRSGAYHLHYSGVSPVSNAKPTNGGYHKYRVMVDLMGSKYLGQNTLLYVIDGLYGGGADEGGQPVKYFMAPFNNNWSNSIFISQDQVALESVCYDFLRTEWNGINKHNPINNMSENMPSVNGVDDYLHQAADSANWPKGITYDPDNSGKPIPSLGVHEHWNNAETKQYSRNLGKAKGIELISIPEELVGPNAYKLTTETKVSKKVKEAPATVPPTSHTRPLSMAPQVVPIEIKGTKFGSVVKRPFGEGFSGRKFMAAVNDDDNETWFLTDVGIVSGIFGAVPKNSKIPSEVLMDFKYELSIDGPRFWIATPQGAVVASLPIDAYSDAIAYNTGNTTILSDSIFSIAIGKNNLRWFGTSKGISALYNKKWLSPLSQKQYPESRFKDYPITAMATSTNGDSLYVGTKGGGVLRVFRDNVDGISGASDYAQWGPIEMPSDRVYSLCITKDGTQWIGTDMGVARHIGYNTLDNWTVFTKEQGLIDNFIQAIAVDAEGKLWFGTKGGVSVFDGSTWTSYTMNDGMISNNILCILVDKLGIIYLGTDNGLMTYNNETGQLVCFQ
jgi:hypothetical protein